MVDNGMLLVNFGALQQGSADIQKALNTMQSQLSQLASDAGPLVATWDGAAQAAYQTRQRKWTSASDDLANILRNIKVAVDESAQDYQDTERKAQQRFE
jgi:early secretory antigenic target protein ESAT-6